MIRIDKEKKGVIRNSLSILIVLFLIPNAYADYARGMEYFRKAYAAYESRDLSAAVNLIQSAINEDPENAQNFALQGDIYYNLQDLAAAKKAWEKALAINPRLDVVRDKLDRLKVEKDVEDKLGASSESIFEIRINKDKEGLIGIEKDREKDKARDDKIIEYLKGAYEAIGDDFDYYPKHKIIVLLYSPEEFKKIRAAPEWVAGLYDGKIRVPRRINKDKEGLTQMEKILRHEYTHALVYDLTKGKCPVFLNEGLAEYEGERIRIDKDKEGLIGIEKGEEKDKEGKKRINKKVYPLVAIFSKNESVTFDAKLFYSSSESLAEYILFIWGWDGMRRLLDLIGAGKPWPDAIKAALNIEPKELEKRWMAWAAEK